MGRRTQAAAAAPALLLVLVQLLATSSRVAVAAAPPFSCGAPSNAPYCDRKLPIEQRAGNLVSKLTLEEKISQLGDESPAVDRLGVPAYKWWSEALHGVANAGRGIHLDGPLRAATSFPQVILTAASFNPHLWYRIGQVIGTEARGVYNNGQAEGLTFWAPNINVFRDPRWGRGQETPGEDPTMTGKYAAVFVRGVQGYAIAGAINSSDLEASACCKHFTAYDLENWKGVTRFAFDAKVTAQDLADTYNPPFKSCVEDGGASGIMCSYNRVNGVPTCADQNLLTKTARGDWGFNGYITSDCDAVAIIHDVQGYAKEPEDAVADVLKAGMDVNCGGYVQTHGLELGLPGMQEQLINSVADAAKKPVILVLLCGGPVDVTFAKNNPKIGAIVWAGYPGQAGGIAIAQVLFGEHNPGGRLPVTWYPKEFTAVPMTDMRMRADPATGYPGRTYRFYKGKTVYNFGYGLSYSKYSHSFVSKGTKPPSMASIDGLKAIESAAGTVSYDVEEIGAEACDRLKFPAMVRVHNEGPLDGRHPVLLFLRWPNATDGRPTSQLIGFQSVHLRASQAAHVAFEVSPCKHFSRAAEDGRKVIDQGSHFVGVGEDEFEMSFMA